MGIRLQTEVAVAAGSTIIDCELDCWVDPERAFVDIIGEAEYAAWLDAGVSADRGWSYLCQLGSSGYVVTGAADDDHVRIEHIESGRNGVVIGSVLDVIERMPRTSTDKERFTVGWVGWLGYELGATLVDAPFAENGQTDSALMFVDRLIAFDHSANRIFLSTLDGARGSEWIAETTARLISLINAPASRPAGPPGHPSEVGWRHSPEEYRAMVVMCQAEIARGQAYQLCLTNELSMVSAEWPLEVYRRLRRRNPGPRGGLIAIGGLAIASSSPELFLEVGQDGYLQTRPIKGTRPRGSTPVADAAFRDELAASDKERAENVMIVDLMRNDFARVATTGSVEVIDLFRIEEYANVFQLVSTVIAQLQPGLCAVDAVRASFPAGSMTGAPKRSAMTILTRLERGARGAYAGAFGYFGLGGTCRLTMTIRTAVFERETSRVTIGTGGGITALSEPDAEVAEMLLKARPLLEALGVIAPP